MSSMEVFATKISASHRQILPQCIPGKRQALLHCRLKSESYCFIANGTIQVSSTLLGMINSFDYAHIFQLFNLVYFLCCLFIKGT
jgi:hypothetical protein